MILTTGGLQLGCISMVGERREDTEKAATLSKPLMKADQRSHWLELPADR